MFSTEANVKGELLAMIILKATVLDEKARLFIHYIMCDAASRNQKIRQMMGVKATPKKIVAMRLYPSNNKRFLYLVPDFTHPMENLCNRLLQTCFDTPSGTVNQSFHIKLVHILVATLLYLW